MRNYNVTKKDNGLIVIALAFIVFIPFLIFTYIHYNKLKKEFPQTETSQRIFDFYNLFPALGTASAIIILGFIGSSWLSESSLSIILVPAFLVFVVWCCYMMAKSIASTYYGVTVDSGDDILLLPKDMANYGIEDYLQLKFIRELGNMESIYLSDITKITRQAGKSLYVHGAFGSRGIHFSNKQKRDECISAIEQASKTKVAFEFENN